MSNGGVQISGITKSFGPGALAVDDLDLRVEPGSFTSLLGPSGCGKTTTLRMIAGLETPDVGEIQILGRTVFSHEDGINVPPHRRKIGFVFQSYALWPHMTVTENLTYPLARAKVEAKHRETQVQATLSLLQCGHLGHRYPGELSGGQQQRVALGRAIVASSNEVVLFDEPLSNLDAKLRDELRFELRALQQELGFTAIYVTHDQAEAMSMSDHIAIMNAGRIEREGSPQSVFHDPHTRYVADFFGGHNLFEVLEWTPTGEGSAVAKTPIGPLTVGLGDRSSAPPSFIAVPVDAIKLCAEEERGSFSAEVEGMAYYGNYSEVRIRSNGVEVRCHVTGSDIYRRGDQVFGRATKNGVAVDG